MDVEKERRVLWQLLMDYEERGAQAVDYRRDYDERWSRAFLASEQKTEAARKAEADLAAAEARQDMERAKIAAKCVEYRVEFQLRLAGRSEP